MTITEIALLRLLPPFTADDPSLREKLAHAKAVMENYTNRRFYILQQIEDPSLVYVVGEWDTLDQHMTGFIPSVENQALLESLSVELTVEWLLHIDAPHSALPLPKTSTSVSYVFSLVRHFIKDGKREIFEEIFEENKHHLQKSVIKGTIGGGWRVDKEDEKEEFVLLCPWDGVEQHSNFAQTDGFQKYGQIRDSLSGSDIKHVRILDL